MWVFVGFAVCSWGAAVGKGSRNWMVFDCGSGFALATEAATSINCDSVESVLERLREMRPGATTPNALRHKENHEASFDRHHKKMPPAR